VCVCVRARAREGEGVGVSFRQQESNRLKHFCLDRPMPEWRCAQNERETTRKRGSGFVPNTAREETEKSGEKKGINHGVSRTRREGTQGEISGAQGKQGVRESKAHAWKRSLLP